MPKRAELRQEKGAPRPFALGRMASGPTRASARKMEPVSDARRLNFPSILGVSSMPGASFDRSSTKPRTSPSSFAQTTRTSAMGAFVIQCLEPLSTCVHIKR